MIPRRCDRRPTTSSRFSRISRRPARATRVNSATTGRKSSWTACNGSSSCGPRAWGPPSRCCRWSRRISTRSNYSRLDPERGMAKFQALIDLYGDHAEGGRSDGTMLGAWPGGSLPSSRAIRRHGGRSSQRRVEPSGRGRAAPPDGSPRAEKICRAVIELYGPKPWAADAVRRASDVLKDGGKR